MLIFQEILCFFERFYVFSRDFMLIVE